MSYTRISILKSFSFQKVALKYNFRQLLFEKFADPHTSFHILPKEVSKQNTKNKN